MQKQTRPTPQRGGAQHWIGSDMETIASTILTQAVPAIMLELMLTKVSFAATNETLNGQFVVEMRDAASFSKNIDMSPYLQRFIDRLHTEVLSDISRNNQISFRLQMLSDILGDTYVTISIGGGPDTDFVLPSFCDALMSPVIGGSNKDLSMVAMDLEQIYSNGATQYTAQPTGMHAMQQPGMNFQQNVGGLQHAGIDDLI
jgi:hypothetical protein